MNRDELIEALKMAAAHYRLGERNFSEIMSLIDRLQPSGDGEREARRILAEEFEADDMQPVADMIRAGGDAHGYAGTALRAMMRFAGDDGPKFNLASPPPAKAAEMGKGWLPIESAPDDGTVLNLFARCKTATSYAPVYGWYHPEMGWIELTFGPNEPVGIVPSHWKPRDAFPVKECK